MMRLVFVLGFTAARFGIVWLATLYFTVDRRAEWLELARPMGSYPYY